MAVPYGKRFPMEFNELFPEGAYVVGEVTALTEYQSQEDKARNRPVRSRIDEVSVNERSGKGTEAKLVAAGSVDVRSAAA
ncbi:MAG: hypothetical protein WCF33_07265 [Pseudonocardiaceae bacterium]